MSHLFPEQPLFIYPSLAKQYGVEEALLLGIYHQFAQHHGHTDADQGWYFISRRSEWQAMTSFWDEEKLALVTSSLVGQGAINAEFNGNGSIRIAIVAENTSSASNSETSIQSNTAVSASGFLDVDRPISGAAYAETALTNTASVMNEQNVTTETEPPLMSPGVGPAPSFGGSTGWARRQDDELEELFKEQEKRHQLLHEITLEWTPTKTTLQLLAKHNIPNEFIDGLKDEFIAYWLAKGQKKNSWDPHFIDHVKRKWVREQGRQGRDNRQAADLNTEASGERYQSTTRAEKRERISKAVMDIKNIDW